MRLHCSMTPRDRAADRRLSLANSQLGTEEEGSASGMDALATVIALYGPTRLIGRGERRASDHALRTVVRRLVEEARRTDPVRGERLLIELRRAWRALPAIQRLPVDGPGDELWDRLVLLCCEEFYAAGGASGARAAHPVDHAR
jgi:hypothetical protein